MREDAIVSQLIEEVDDATASAVGVRTSGGDANVDPPEVILSWSASPLLGEHGHKSFAGVQTDVDGNNDGKEYHAYFTMEVELLIRYRDEVQRDIVADQIQMLFLPYASDSDQFNRDTAEWDIGALTPRGNMFVEPDWYESAVTVSFKYVKRTTDTGYDAIEDIDYDVEINKTINTT